MILYRYKAVLPLIIAGLILLLFSCSKQSTKPADDTTPPVATTLFPAANTTDIPIDTQIFIAFSEAVRADTLEKQFQLLPNLGRKDSVIYDPQSFKLILIPDTTLSYQTTYHCRIDPGITDLSGNPFSDNKLFIWSFTTRRDPSPYLISVFPVDSSVNVEPDAIIQLTFNKAMNKDHLLAKFRLLSPDGAVSGQLTYDENDFRLSFDPDSLNYRTTYTIELAEGIESADGYVFNNAQRYQSIFTVRAPDQIQVLDFYPRETNVTSEVLDSLEFWIQAKGDSISYSWYKDNNLDTDAKTGTFRTFFSTTGLHSIDAVVKDMYNQNASRHWNVDVRNTDSEFSSELSRNPGQSAYAVGDTVYIKIDAKDLTGLREIGLDFNSDGVVDKVIKELSGKNYNGEAYWVTDSKGEFKGIAYVEDIAGKKMQFDITRVDVKDYFNQITVPLSLNEGQKVEYDIAKHLNFPDREGIEYEVASDNDSLKVSMDGTKIKVDPGEDFNGQGWITLYAINGGNVIDTMTINANVKKQRDIKFKLVDAIIDDYKYSDIPILGFNGSTVGKTNENGEVSAQVGNDSGIVVLDNLGEILRTTEVPIRANSAGNDTSMTIYTVSKGHPTREIGYIINPLTGYNDPNFIAINRKWSDAYLDSNGVLQIPVIVEISPTHPRRNETFAMIDSLNQWFKRTILDGQMQYKIVAINNNNLTTSDAETARIQELVLNNPGGIIAFIKNVSPSGAGNGSDGQDFPYQITKGLVTYPIETTMNAAKYEELLTVGQEGEVPDERFFNTVYASRGIGRPYATMQYNGIPIVVERAVFNTQMKFPEGTIFKPNRIILPKRMM